MPVEVIEREPLRFYPDRPGVNIDQTISVLSASPEYIPSVEEKRNVLMMEQALTTGEDLYSVLLNDESSDREKVQGVEKIYLQDKVNTLDFFVEYYTSTDEGRDALVGLGFETKDTDIHERDVVEFFSGLDYSGIPSKEIAGIAEKSQAYIEGVIADQMEKNNYESVEGITTPTKITIVKNPDALASRLEKLRSLKGFLKDYGQSEAVAGSEPMQVIVNLHKRRVNELIASSYADAISLVKQYKASPTEATRELIERISEVSPISFESSEIGSYALSRVDKYLNGAGEKEDRDYSPVSHEDMVLAAEVLRDRGRATEGIGEYGHYKDVYDDARVKSSQELQQWIKKVLDNYGILSSDSEEEYDSDSSEMAKDAKWRVVVDPTAKNLAINGLQRVVKIPPKFNRSLSQLSPAGAVPLIDHEIDHVVQWENKAKMGLALTRVVGIDRSVVCSEGGGVAHETDSQRNLFGQKRGTNTDYIIASIEKLKGGNYLDCVKVFFDNNMDGEPTKDKRKAAQLAANRVLRLFRKNGDLSNTDNFLANSQPLEYLEQELIAKKLREIGKEKLLVYGVNINALSELHRVGLVDINDIWVPEKSPSEVLKFKIEAKFKEASGH